CVLFGVSVGAYGAGVEDGYALTRHCVLFGVSVAGAYGAGVEDGYALTRLWVLFGISVAGAYGAGVEDGYALTRHCVLFGILAGCAYGAGVEDGYALTRHCVLFGILAGCAYGAGVEDGYALTRHWVLFGILAGAYGASVEDGYALTRHWVLFDISVCAYGAGVEDGYALTTHCIVPYLSGYVQHVHPFYKLTGLYLPYKTVSSLFFLNCTMINGFEFTQQGVRCTITLEWQRVLTSEAWCLQSILAMGMFVFTIHNSYRGHPLIGRNILVQCSSIRCKFGSNLVE
ncbi:unnamed protein product, partial [Rhizoctonia solani]